MVNRQRSELGPNGLLPLMNYYHSIEDNSFLFNVRTEEILVFYAIETYSSSELHGHPSGVSRTLSWPGIVHHLSGHNVYGHGVRLLAMRTRLPGSAVHHPSGLHDHPTPLKKSHVRIHVMDITFFSHRLCALLSSICCFSVLVYSNWRQMRYSTLYNV